MKKWIYIAPLILLLSCEKKIQTDPTNVDPVFAASFDVDGNNFSWEAGVEDYYMFTGKEIDSFDIAESWGTLKPQAGTEKNAIQFKFRNTETGAFQVDSALKIGERRLVDSACGFAQNTKVKVKFIPTITTGITGQKWTINANIISNLAEPEFTFDTTEFNNFPVYLHTYFETGCIGSTKRCLDFKNMDCSAQFDFHHDTGMTYQFYLPSSIENSVEKVIWYIGDDVFDSKSLTYTFSSTGNHFVNADVFFKDGCSSCIGKKLQVDPMGSTLTCNNNFRMEFTSLDNDDHLQLGRIEVNYWDENGVLYSSRFSKHNESINITDVSDYIENHQGQSTKKVELNGDFELANALGETIQISNFNGVIGVAY